MKARLGVPLVCALAGAAWAQSPNAQLPRFEDYPVTAIFKGTPAAPRFVRPEERRYRTAIRQGVGPNFAGHYIVVQWGCGSECLQYAIVDAKTGRIFQPPVPGKRSEYFDTGFLEFHLRSNLMIVNTNCAAGDSERCDKDYFVWTNERFKHIYRQPRD